MSKAVRRIKKNTLIGSEGTKRNKFKTNGWCQWFK